MFATVISVVALLLSAGALAVAIMAEHRSRLSFKDVNLTLSASWVGELIELRLTNEGPGVAFDAEAEWGALKGVAVSHLSDIAPRHVVPNTSLVLLVAPCDPSCVPEALPVRVYGRRRWPRRMYESSAPTTVWRDLLEAGRIEGR
ncbi:MAG: hypothetical protein SO046_02850 [Actinomyces urogenitalis]|uniref:hypothetical protein n=1 Tax=Actinomyces urogenitalis TaxID=103621 RepID=UPI002A807317|nr:hypothetical protein [Actinomyces urogenitalis]MDY3678143.1 hypothetical protein [Actinomyces urogenitalis]